MDGSNAAFLLDAPLVSPPRPAARGILYIEDFDVAAEPAPASEPAPPPAPVITEADVQAAHAQGREEGLQAALADTRALQAQLHAAALQSTADSLAASRAMLETIAQRRAEDVARTLMAVLHAAIPATMRTHANIEIEAVIQALMPGLKSAPELRVRAHPDCADLVRDTLAAGLPAEACVLCVCADPTLEPADIRVAWQDGYAARNATAIWAAITAALAPLGLPSFQEIVHGQ